MFLQSYVTPICLYEVLNGSAVIRELIGTSFIVGSRGLLVSARHVFESARTNSLSKGLQVGIVAKANNGTDAASEIVPINDYEFAPAPYDIGVALTGYKCQSPLRLTPLDVTEWAEIATLGYPLQAVSGPSEGLNLNLRCHRGYIQRRIRPGDLKIGNHPESFELNFLIGTGVSGAPLFVHKGNVDVVIGVCVGSIRTEVIEDEFIEVQDDGTKYKELKLKIEQFGIAHEIRLLLDWRPKLFGGLSLREMSEVT